MTQGWVEFLYLGESSENGATKVQCMDVKHDLGYSVEERLFLFKRSLVGCGLEVWIIPLGYQFLKPSAFLTRANFFVKFAQTFPTTFSIRKRSTIVDLFEG